VRSSSYNRAKALRDMHQTPAQAATTLTDPLEAQLVDQFPRPDPPTAGEGWHDLFLQLDNYDELMSLTSACD
jgi:hypothetical protein